MSENTVTNQSNPPHAHARQANLELLRCVAMMMVIVLHYLGKGNLLVSLDAPWLYPAEYVAWLLETDGLGYDVLWYVCVYRGHSGGNAVGHADPWA